MPKHYKLLYLGVAYNKKYFDIVLVLDIFQSVNRCSKYNSFHNAVFTLLAFLGMQTKYFMQKT